MGEAITRLNPLVESNIQKILFVQAITIVLKITMLLPEMEHNSPGPKPYDYRMIIGLCILRILFKKTYADYEIEMRTDLRICNLVRLQMLPSKSTIQRGMQNLKMSLLRDFNRILIANYVKRKLNISLDASGIRIIGRSIWHSIRIKKPVSRRECDKVHLAICNDQMLILNWFITQGKKHDSPFFKRLLAPFKLLGVVLADAGYLSRKNFQFVADRKGSAFILFKSNSTAKPKSNPAWKIAFNLWNTIKSIYKGIYHQRSRIECVFFVLKKRFGDKLNTKRTLIRRKEMALRFISYNMRLIICLDYSTKNNLPMWVRAKKLRQ